eukprot:5748792-Alexandrium_andersonii.AAC.1
MSLDCFAVDLLHTVHLGVLLNLLKHALWALMEADLFGIGGPEEAMRFQLTALRYRADLMAHYKALPPAEKAKTTQ